MAINQTNVVVMEGNLADEPAVREVTIQETGEVKAAATIRIANNRLRRKGEHVSFHDVEFFGQTAAFVRDYCKKGDTVIVEGENDQDRWTDAEDNKRAKSFIRGRSIQKRRSANDRSAAALAGDGVSAGAEIEF